MSRSLTTALDIVGASCIALGVVLAFGLAGTLVVLGAACLIVSWRNA